MSKDKVSVVVVNFNSGPLLVQCVQSVLSSSVSLEVFVSDNGSTDGSIHLLKQEIDDDRLHIIMNNENLGFACANNSVISLMIGSYLLILNPDCLVRKNTLESMIVNMDLYPEVGMAGCLIANLDGTEQAGCRRRVPTPARSLIRMLLLDRPFPFLKEKGVAMHQLPLPNIPIDVEAISGAFMLVRRRAMEEVGLMDEKYFLHCEDLDWCMRFRQKGWKILFVPDVEVVHTKGVCSDARPIRVEWHKHWGMIRFYRKFFRHQYPLPLMFVVFVAVFLRFIGIACLSLCRRALS